MVNLGSEVKDMITGMKGIAIGRTEWLYGCARVGIQPKGVTKEGKAKETVWFDEQGIKVLKEGKPIVQITNSAKSGGPQRDPKRVFEVNGGFIRT